MLGLMLTGCGGTEDLDVEAESFATSEQALVTCNYHQDTGYRSGTPFTLTLVTIHLMPYLVDALGWRYAFVPLALGPAAGVWAMARLRAHPRSLALAGGRR